MLYWFTVDSELPDVLDVGIRNGIWGVPDEARDAIEPLEPGDLVLFFQRDHGFVMCEVESEPYTESVPVWTDVDYPHRVRISDPVETDRYAHLGEVHDCLTDAESGEPFTSVSKAAAALSGAGGRFRRLDDDEIRCLFRRLGWALPPDVDPAPEAGEAEEVEEADADPPAATEVEQDEGAPAADAGPEDAEGADGDEEAASADEGPADAEPARAEPVGADGEEPAAPGPEEETAEARPVGPSAADEPPTSEEREGVAEARPVAADGAAGEEGGPGEVAAADAGEGAAPEPRPEDEGSRERPEGAEAGDAAPEDAAPEAVEAVPQVLLAPATGDAESRRRFDATMADGVEAGDLEAHLSDDDLEALGVTDETDRVRVWGTPAGPRGRRRAAWEGAGRGDVVLFTGAGRVFASARVLLVREDPDLAAELWGGEDDEAWPLLLFVTSPVSQDVPADELADLGGFEAGEGDDRFAFRLLDAEHSLRVLGAFPELGLTTPAGRDETAVARPGVGGEGRDGAPSGAAADETAGADPRLWSGGVGAMDEARLRVLLFGRRPLGRCALCGRLLPVDLLSVVYVKPLPACEPDELEDVGNNVLPACRLGCAGLFRQGFVVVEDGRVERGRTSPMTEPVAERIEEIEGTRCGYWHSGSEPYFRWHAEQSRDA